MILRILFLVISALGLSAAAGVVLSRNLIRAALFLVAFFFIVACQFVLLEAEFLAVVQVLIYIGAVAILILFGIMLTRNIQGDTVSTTWVSRVPGLIAGLAVLVVLLIGIRGRAPGSPGVDWRQASRPAITVESPSGTAPSERGWSIANMTRFVGHEMMTRYLVAFEVAGLLLTAAVVGALALTIEEHAPDEADRTQRALPARPDPSGDRSHPPGPQAATSPIESVPHA